MMMFIINKDVNFFKIIKNTLISIFNNDIFSNVLKKIEILKISEMIYFNFSIILNSSEMAKCIWYKI